MESHGRVEWSRRGVGLRVSAYDGPLVNEAAGPLRTGLRILSPSAVEDRRWILGGRCRRRRWTYRFGRATTSKRPSGSSCTTQLND
jgi:hypothetical protein